MRKLRRWGLAALAMIASAALGWALGWRWRDHHQGVEAWHMGDVPTWVGAIATTLALAAAAIAARGAYKQLEELKKQVRTQDDTLDFQKRQASDDRIEAARVRQEDREEAARVRAEDLAERERTRELDRRADRDAQARVAAALLLERLADLDAALPFVPLAQRDSYMSRLARGNPDPLASLRRGLMTELPVVADPLITKHYNHLDSMILYFHNAQLDEAELNRAQLEIGRYLRWVQMLISAFVAEKPPLEDVKPPVIVAGHVLDAKDDWQPDPQPEGWE